MDNNPNISHPSSGTVPNTELIMNNQLNNMQPNIKTEDSPPAEEALDMLLQNEENVLLSDLAEFLKRDPTLSTIKTESDNLLKQEQQEMQQQQLQVKIFQI